MLIMFEWSFFQVEVNWQNYVTLAHSPEIRGLCMMKWPSEVFKLCQDFRNICSLINSLDKWMVYVNCKNMVKFESLQWNISSSIKLVFSEEWSLVVWPDPTTTLYYFWGTFAKNSNFQSFYIIQELQMILFLLKKSTIFQVS